jgi:hypothetical protein
MNKYIRIIKNEAPFYFNEMFKIDDDGDFLMCVTDMIVNEDGEDEKIEEYIPISAEGYLFEYVTKRVFDSQWINSDDAKIKKEEDEEYYLDDNDNFDDVFDF